jgi:hypothetical protein
VILAPNTYFHNAFCIVDELPNWSSVITALNAQQLVTQVLMGDYAAVSALQQVLHMGPNKAREDAGIRLDSRNSL